MRNSADIGSAGRRQNRRLQCVRSAKEQWARPDSNRRPPPCEGSFLELEPLLCLSNNDCRLVKELLTSNGREHSQDLSASYRQTDSNEGLFLERTAGNPQVRAKEVPKDGLASLELQFDHDELVNYTQYRKTELTRKSADWINRASIAFWLSSHGIISAKTLSDLRKETLAKYKCEDSKSKVLTFAAAFLKYLAKTHL